MNNYKLRASYSYLSLWSSGRWEEAIKAYFKLDRFISRAMAEGSDYHDEWQNHCVKTKTLPAVFGGAKLNKPVCEDKKVIPVYDWLDLVIKADCIDSPIIHEFKTGILGSDDYVPTYQPAIYAVGCVLLKIPVERIQIHAYNQYAKTSTFSEVEVTESLLKKGLEYVESVGSEMHNYFVENGLYERYSQKEN